MKWEVEMIVTTISPEKLVKTLSEVEVVLLPRTDYEALLRQSRAQLSVVMEQDEDGGYTVTCPALPGCVSEGKTREGALENIREAIAGYLEAAEIQAQMAVEGVEIERVTV